MSESVMKRNHDVTLLLSNAFSTLSSSNLINILNFDFFRKYCWTSSNLSLGSKLVFVSESGH